MELGIFSRTYPCPDPEECFRRMRQQGIRLTQLNLSNAGMETLPRTLDENKLERLAEARDCFAVRFCALSGTFNLIDPDREARERGIRQLRLQCRIASRLGIPLVSLCTGSRNRESKWKWHDDNASEAAWTDLLRSMERILPYAEEADLFLGIEPEISNVVFSAQRARRLLDEFKSPRLRIILDGANLLRPGDRERMADILEDGISLLYPEIALVHAKDLMLEQGPRYVAPGKGELDFGCYLGLLKKYDLNTPLIMHGLEEAEVPTSRDYLLGKLEEAGYGEL